MDPIYEIVTADNLTYEQKVVGLAHAAEDTLDVLDIPERTRYFFQIGALHDMYEGHAPYRPRYVMPDYEKFVQQGSEFLGLTPPETFDELLVDLVILYRHVPSITTFPVYLGNLDYLFEPFIGDLSDEEVKTKLKYFFTYLDRTITDSFCHANLGPEPTRAARLILEVEKDLENPVPNFTLLYDRDVTPDDLAEQAIYTSLFCANPAICNHNICDTVYPCRYGVSSCYNVLPYGGGAYTLTRFTMPKLAAVADSVDQFMDVLLPDFLECMGNYMNERVSFLVEKSNFFESSFLVKEGLVDKDRFVGMFGLTGLAECVDILLEDRDLRYGRDEEADVLAERIMQAIADFAATFPAKYSKVSDGHFLLHAQVGLDCDAGVTSGVRIPVGEEPASIYDHLRHTARMHKQITTGCGDIFPFETTGRQNPAAILDIVKGGFDLGVKYLSFYAEDADLVRITGYLVKRSEIEKFEDGQCVLQDTTQLGGPYYRLAHLEDRKVRGL